MRDNPTRIRAPNSLHCKSINILRRNTHRHRIILKGLPTPTTLTTPDHHNLRPFSHPLTIRIRRMLNGHTRRIRRRPPYQNLNVSNLNRQTGPSPLPLRLINNIRRLTRKTPRPIRLPGRRLILKPRRNRHNLRNKTLNTNPAKLFFLRSTLTTNTLRHITLRIRILIINKSTNMTSRRIEVMSRRNVSSG